MNRNRNNTVFVLLAFALGLVGATARDTAMIKQHDALTMKEVALLETGVYGDDDETDTKAKADMQATEAEAETKAPGLKAIVREIFNHTKKAPLTAMREMKVTLDGFKNKYAVGDHSYCGKEKAAKKAECTSEAVTVSNKTKSLIGYVDNYIKKKEAFSKMAKYSPMKAPARLAYEGYWAGIRIKGLFHERRKINLHKKFKCMSICADFFRDHPEGVEGDGGTAAIKDSLENELKSDCCVEQENSECNIGVCTPAQVTIISAARTALASTPYFQKLGDYIHESRKKKSGTVQRFAAATAVTSGDVKETAVKVLETTVKVVVFAAVVAACISFLPICLIVVLLSML